MKTNVIEEKMIYTTHEVAKILHSSPNYIYELIEKGKLKAIKLKSFKIRKSAVEEFLKENEGMIYQILIILRKYQRIMKKDSKIWEMLQFKKEENIININLK